MDVLPCDTKPAADQTKTTHSSLARCMGQKSITTIIKEHHQSARQSVSHHQLTIYLSISLFIIHLFLYFLFLLKKDALRGMRLIVF